MEKENVNGWKEALPEIITESLKLVGNTFTVVKLPSLIIDGLRHIIPSMSQLTTDLITR